MSQGTPINKLNGNSMNDEDSRLVDSILNDLNSGSDSGDMQGGMPPGGMPQAGGRVKSRYTWKQMTLS